MRVLLAGSLALLASAGSAYAESPLSYDEIMTGAAKAYQNAEWAELEASLKAAALLRPYSLYLERNRILASALAGRPEEAIARARRLADRGLSLDLGGHEALESLSLYPEFVAVKQRMKANERPFGRHAIILETDDTGLLPESLALSDRGDARRLLIGSVTTGGIYEAYTDESGSASLSLIHKGPGGVFFITQTNDRLWAAIASAPPFVAANGSGQAGFAAYVADVPQAECVVAVDHKDAIIGAVAQTPIGMIATDSGEPRLFLIEDECNAGPVEWSTDPRFVNLQGIVYEEVRQKLFVADYLVGLFSIDLATGSASLLANPSDAHLGGIDGLYLHNGSLIAVQNGTTPPRVVRLRLDEQGDAVTSLEVLQNNLDLWNEPTGGAVAGDEFYYIATSNWPAYDRDGQLKQDATLAPLRILSTPLD